MKIKRFLRDALVAAVAFLGLQSVQSVLLNHALAEQNRVLAYRLAASVAGILNNAHKAKDDLTLYQLITALAQSPGILDARIAGLDNAGGSVSVKGAYVYPLKEGDHKWGSLVLSLSNHFSQKLLRRQWLIGTGIAGFIWVLLFFFLQRLEKKSLALEARLVELDGLLQMEKRKLNNYQEQELSNSLRAAAYLRKAMERVAGPLMVLDAQQRIAAINREALAQLDLAGVDPEKVRQKSWYEIPILGSCGAALERSMAFPGHAVKWVVAERDLELTFETDGEGLAGTWVMFSTSKHIVELKK